MIQTAFDKAGQMTLKDIVVHLDQSATSAMRLTAGLTIAKENAARVRGVFLTAEPTIWSSPGHHLPAELRRDYAEQAEIELRVSLDATIARAAQLGVPFEVHHRIAPVDALPSTLALEVRHSDLVIVGQPQAHEGSADDVLMCEAAFMQSGRPALMIPSSSVDFVLPKRVALAWDGSREAARAIHDALPLLSAQTHVALLILNPDDLGSRIGSPPGVDMQSHLRAHGIPSVVETIDVGMSSIAKAIVSQIHKDGYELLVMGAHGRSLLREVLSGSTTRSVIEHATFPTLLSH